MRGIGVAVITSTCGACAFFDQALALQHAEAVLLVHDHQAQLREFHRVFDQRVRADEQLRFAGSTRSSTASLSARFRPLISSSTP